MEGHRPEFKCVAYCRAPIHCPRAIDGQMATRVRRLSGTARCRRPGSGSGPCRCPRRSPAQSPCSRWRQPVRLKRRRLSYSRFPSPPRRNVYLTWLRAKVSVDSRAGSRRTQRGERTRVQRDINLTLYKLELILGKVIVDWTDRVRPLAHSCGGAGRAASCGRGRAAAGTQRSFRQAGR
jgi:hypothetical protein